MSLEIKPLPVQQWAMECPAFELLFGGAKGGGKTFFLVACWLELLQFAHEKFLREGRAQRKCRIMVFRKNLEDLKDFEVKCHEIYPIFDPGASYNVNSKTWTFSSGATLAMRHLDGPTDHLGYNGNEFVGLGFDEVQQISYDAYSFLVAQVRTSDPEYRPFLRVRCTANPGGEDWIITHFKIDEHPMGGKVFNIPVVIADGRTVNISRVFIRSWLKDNPYLDPDGTYEAQLRASMSEDAAAQYLDGDFFRVAGAFFSKFIRPSVHFVRSYPVPSSWEFRFAMDWGSTNPAAWLLGARDNDGRLYVIDELVTPGVTGRTFGEKLDERYRHQKWCGDKVFRNDDFWGVIDKQAMDKYGGEGTAAEGICEWGFRLFEAQKDRIAGCNQMKERLLLDRHGNPQVVIFEDRCPQLVRALSAIQSNAPKNPEEYNPDSAHSHVCDAFRFLCMEFPVTPVRIDDPVDADVARWEKYLRDSRAKGQQQRGWT